jgi:hypothetical protein
VSDDARKRALIQRFWDHIGVDHEISHEIYAEDAILEFPQSGERFEGLANFKEWRGQYPAAVRLEMTRMRGAGDIWVIEGTISYDGGPPTPTVAVLEFRGDEVIRETIYLAEPWEAPDWRAPWRATP